MNVISAGLLAGFGMAAVMGVGELLGLVKINLPRVDGEFFFKDRFGKPITYLLGLVIHLGTSICFAVGYFLFRRYGVPHLPWLGAGLLWAIVLWLAFGLTVSPVTGSGWFGSKAGKWTWFELLITHCAYGLIVSLCL
ncbi:MAG: hypothetical protein HYZ90_00900 [Candidatus Omnitrophica bacterium]|nr:hypothetical protein [Candidatus Omnitrophota bacterium]